MELFDFTILVGSRKSFAFEVAGKWKSQHPKATPLPDIHMFESLCLPNPSDAKPGKGPDFTKCSTVEVKRNKQTFQPGPTSHVLSHAARGCRRPWRNPRLFVSDPSSLHPWGGMTRYDYRKGTSLARVAKYTMHYNKLSGLAMVSQTCFCKLIPLEFPEPPWMSQRQWFYHILMGPRITKPEQQRYRPPRSNHGWCLVNEQLVVLV